MRYKNIRISFYFALLSVVFLRFLQFFVSLDPVTGFIKPDYKLIGFGLLALTIIISFCMAGIGFTIKRCPVKVPRLSLFSGVFSLALALSIVYDLVIIGNSANIPGWQTLLLRVTGVLAALFFGALFASSLKKFNIPDFMYVAPVLYYLIKLIYLFTASSIISLISDNLLYLLTHIFSLLFMFEFCVAKFQKENHKNFKKVAATGYATVMLAAATSIPQLAAWYANSPASQRVDFTDAFTTFCTGLFIFSFLGDYFSGYNVRIKSRSKSHYKKSDSTEDNFYTG